MKTLMGYVGEALLAVLMQDSLPAFNLHAIHALANDMRQLGQLCSRGLSELPDLEVGHHSQPSAGVLAQCMASW